MSLQSFIGSLSSKAEISSIAVRAAIQYFQEGLTVPFVVRYKHEDVQNIDGRIGYIIYREYEAYESMCKIRKNRIEKFKISNNYDPVIVKEMENCLTIEDLDAIWEVCKETKTPKFQKAEEIPNLIETAVSILGNTRLEIPSNLASHSDLIEYVMTKEISKDIDNVTSVLNTCKNHLRVVSSQSLSKKSNEKDKPSKDTHIRGKYNTYYDFDRNVHDIQPHQVLALRRGKDENEIALKFTIPENLTNASIFSLRSKYHINKPKPYSSSHPTNRKASKGFADDSIDDETGQLSNSSLINKCISNAIMKYIYPNFYRSKWNDCIKVAEEKSLNIFGNNLKHVLLTPKLSSYMRGSKVVCAVDPGFSNGHKIVFISCTNGVCVLDRMKIYPMKVSAASTSDPFPPPSPHDLSSYPSAYLTFAESILKYDVDIIAIGNGTGSQNAQQLIREYIAPLIATLQRSNPSKDCKRKDYLKVSIVNETGASVYSVSEIAKAEYPNEEICYLGAISIASRLIDPLNEMIKIPPASLGIGMYQHDISEKLLSKYLTTVVEEVVNEVGVDLNTASEFLLKYVSGFNVTRAKQVIEHRATQGPFTSLQQLKLVKGIGEVTFKNCVGFLRLGNSTEPLDYTVITPDRYTVTYMVLDAIGFTAKHGKLKMKHMLRTSTTIDYSQDVQELQAKIPLEEYLKSKEWNVEEISHQINQPVSCVADIMRWLRMSCVEDVRDATRPAVINVPLNANITEEKQRQVSDNLLVSEKNNNPTAHSTSQDLETVEVGRVFCGVVRNITTFGVFVDLGCHQDGLLHVSEYYSKKTQFSIGQSMQVRVKDVDVDRRRISLALAGEGGGAPLSASIPSSSSPATMAPVVSTKTSVAGHSVSSDRIAKTGDTMVTTGVGKLHKKRKVEESANHTNNAKTSGDSGCSNSDDIVASKKIKSKKREVV